MLKETITYTDYNDIERTEDFYFNLTKSELMTLEATTTGGLVDRLKTMLAAKDGVAIMNFFTFLLHKAYGEKSLDGKQFVKSDDISNAFEQTPAYDQLFMRLVTNADDAAKFVNGVLPPDLRSAKATN